MKRRRGAGLASLWPMADHPHTIDRWDDTTGETLSSRLPPSATTSSRWRLTGRRSNAGLVRVMLTYQKERAWSCFLPRAGGERWAFLRASAYVRGRPR